MKKQHQRQIPWQTDELKYVLQKVFVVIVVGRQCHRLLSHAPRYFDALTQNPKMWNCATLFGANCVLVCASSLFDSQYFTVYSVFHRMTMTSVIFNAFRCCTSTFATRRTSASNEGFFGPCRIYDVNGIGVHTSVLCSSEERDAIEPTQCVNARRLCGMVHATMYFLLYENGIMRSLATTSTRTTTMTTTSEEKSAAKMLCAHGTRH